MKILFLAFFVFSVCIWTIASKLKSECGLTVSMKYYLAMRQLIKWSLVAVLVSALGLFAVSASAQDLQSRTVAHITVDLTDRWFVPVWSITNLKTQSPNNTNLFFGLGYRGENWWVEEMVQKQYSSVGGLWSVDSRFRWQKQRIAVYVEPAMLWTPSPALYEFVTVEERLWRGLSFRQETENVHRLSRQSVAVGPGLSYNLGQHGGWDVGVAGAYRFSPTGKNELRGYFVFSKRIKRH